MHDKDISKSQLEAKERNGDSETIDRCNSSMLHSQPEDSQSTTL